MSHKALYWPLLFLLYINDMVNCINDEDVKLVDDMQMIPIS